MVSSWSVRRHCAQSTPNPLSAPASGELPSVQCSLSSSTSLNRVVSSVQSLVNSSYSSLSFKEAVSPLVTSATAW